MSKIQRKPQDINGIDRILKSISPVMKLENIYGIFRHRIVDRKLVSISTAFKIYGIIIMCIFVIPFAVLFIFYISQINHFNLEILIVLAENISIFIMALQYVLSMIIFIKTSERNIRLIKNLSKIDNILHISNCDHFFKKSGEHVLLLVLSFLILYSLSCVPQFIDKDCCFIYRIFVISIDFERHLEIFVLCIFVKILIDRLNVLNNYLLTFI